MTAEALRGMLLETAQTTFPDHTFEYGERLVTDGKGWYPMLVDGKYAHIAIPDTDFDGDRKFNGLRGDDEIKSLIVQAIDGHLNGLRL